MATHISYDQASQNLKMIIDRVSDDREIVIIDRPGAKGVALVAAHELSGLLETVHLLRSPKNADRLLEALNRASEGLCSPSGAKIKKLKNHPGIHHEPS